MILSFAWTTDALLSGKKTCTRRQWSDRTARGWLNAYDQGRLVHQAWTNAPFVQGARKVADICLTQLPYQERLADMPESDLEAEGGLWADKEEFLNLFGDPDLIVWVVRFELLQLADGCRDGLAQQERQRRDVRRQKDLSFRHNARSEMATGRELGSESPTEIEETVAPI